MKQVIKSETISGQKCPVWEFSRYHFEFVYSRKEKIGSFQSLTGFQNKWSLLKFQCHAGALMALWIIFWPIKLNEPDYFLFFTSFGCRRRVLGINLYLNLVCMWCSPFVNLVFVYDKLDINNRLVREFIYVYRSPCNVQYILSGFDFW